MEKTIIRKIEELRLELNKLSANKCLADREVVRISQKLDEALNEYNQLRSQGLLK